MRSSSCELDGATRSSSCELDRQFVMRTSSCESKLTRTCELDRQAERYRHAIEFLGYEPLKSHCLSQSKSRISSFVHPSKIFVW
jgi:hypothetical protein